MTRPGLRPTGEGNRPTSNLDLPFHQARQEEVAGLREFLALLIKVTDLGKHLTHGLIEQSGEGWARGSGRSNSAVRGNVEQLNAIAIATAVS